MVNKSTEQFYVELPEFTGKIIDLLSEESQFQPIPSDWVVVVTDIKQSTVAIQKGLYQAINLIATACIVSALNIAKEYDVNFPFFFGGDGSTLIIPPNIK